MYGAQLMRKMTVDFHTWKLGLVYKISVSKLTSRRSVSNVTESGGGTKLKVITQLPCLQFFSSSISACANSSD